MHGIINFRVYEDGTEYLGLANVQLPNISNKSITVNGAGIAGDINFPVLGQTEALETTIAFTDNPRASEILAEQRVHDLTLMAAHQRFDSVDNEIDVDSIKHNLKVLPMSVTGGTVAPASQQGKSNTYACIYYACYRNGEKVLEVDKIHNKYVDAAGVDRNDAVNSALGGVSTSQI